MTVNHLCGSSNSSQGILFNLTILKCDGNEQQCNTACLIPEASQKHKAQALASSLNLIRSFPPSYKNEWCKKVREFCYDECVKNGSLEETRCRIDCEQYESFNK